MVSPVMLAAIAVDHSVRRYATSEERSLRIGPHSARGRERIEAMRRGWQWQRDSQRELNASHPPLLARAEPVSGQGLALAVPRALLRRKREQDRRGDPAESPGFAPRLSPEAERAPSAEGAAAPQLSPD